MKYEIAGIKRSIVVNGIGDPSHAIDIAIKRQLRMEWLKENNITSKAEAKNSLAHIDFDKLKERYGFKLVA